MKATLFAFILTLIAACLGSAAFTSCTEPKEEGTRSRIDSIDEDESFIITIENDVKWDGITEYEP